MSEPTELPSGLVCAMDDSGLTGEDRRQVAMYAEFLALAPEIGDEMAYRRAYGREMWR